VAILCGGRGTRLQERTGSIPKPMVEIGGRPIVWHVIQIYLAQGFDRVLLLTGYRGEQIERFVMESDWPQGVEITCLDTGVDTPTGGRVHLARTVLGDEEFCLTYADGVADVDLTALLAEHARNGATATMTVVQPELQFGVAQLGEDGRVRGFTEKPRSEHWINGGFFCCTPAMFEVLEPDSVLERGPLERLAAAGALRAYRHDGYWECMDTYKDAVVLNDLWATGGAPWKLWH
jgi:glucose-1-phosphate cytidylyltransferase